jgi:hypothetical protein
MVAKSAQFFGHKTPDTSNSYMQRYVIRLRRKGMSYPDSFVRRGLCQNLLRDFCTPTVSFFVQYILRRNVVIYGALA